MSNKIIKKNDARQWKQDSEQAAYIHSKMKWNCFVIVLVILQEYGVVAAFA